MNESKRQRPTKKIEIRIEKNCAWCEINGTFVYGKNLDEVRAALDMAAAKLKPWTGFGI